MNSTKRQQVCLPSLRLLGDYWTLRIIDELSDGSLRFCELERKLEGVNTATLAKRLKDMQGSGLLEREERSKADVTYDLTSLGQAALPLIDAVNEFSAANRAYQKRHALSGGVSAATTRV